MPERMSGGPWRSPISLLSGSAKASRKTATANELRLAIARNGVIFSGRRRDLSAPLSYAVGRGADLRASRHEVNNAREAETQADSLEAFGRGAAREPAFRHRRQCAEALRQRDRRCGARRH